MPDYDERQLPQELAPTTTPNVDASHDSRRRRQVSP